MAKLHFIAAFVIVSLFCHAQSAEILIASPEITPRGIAKHWKNSDCEKQKATWDNGKTRIEYQSLTDSTRLRKEYYENGFLRFIAEVRQEWRDDTVYTEDIETGEFTIGVFNGYVDILHGSYTEYKNWGLTPYLTGSFRNNIVQGRWSLITNQNDSVVVNYNKRGWLEGPYQIYYSNPKGKRNKLKCTGQFEIKAYMKAEDNIETGVLEQSLVSESVESGVWSFFRLDGSLQRTVTYEWSD